MVDGALAVAVDLDAAALVVGRRADGYHVARDVDANAETLGVDGGEALDEVLLAYATGVEVEVVLTAELHLIVDSAGHDVARCQTQTAVVLLHELLAVAVLQYGSCAAHGLGDEEGGLLGGVVQRSGMELHKLQVAEHAAGTVHHSHTVASGNDGSGGGRVDVAHAAGGQEGHLGQVGVNAVGVAVEGIDAVALDVGRVLRHTLTQVVLGDDVDGELPLLDFDIGVRTGGLEQAALYLLAGVVLVVQDAELRVSAFTMQVELVAFAVKVEVNAVLHQLADAVGGLADGHLHHLAVTDAVAGHQGVVDMLVETVRVVHHRSDAALGIARAAFAGVTFGEDAHLAVRGHLEGETEAGDTRAYHKKINFVTHNLTMSDE